MSRSVPESDWKLLSELKPLALQRYCDGVLARIASISSDSSKSSHERYGNVYGYVQEADKVLAYAFNALSRSNAIDRLAAMVSLKLLTKEELQRFSASTRDILRDFGSCPID